MTILQHDIRAWFELSNVDAACQPVHWAARDLGLLMLKTLPQGLELEAAMQALRQAVMWADAGMRQAGPVEPASPSH